MTHLLLVHGTFVGDDPAGLLTSLERHLPSLAAPLRSVAAGMPQLALGELALYTTGFAETLARGLNPASQPAIHVQRFTWSGRNNHLGRADGAVRLLIALHETHPAPGNRLLLWGHSHAGNVFAILTHLLAADRDTLARFLFAAREFYESPRTRHIEQSHWQRARELLLDAPQPPLAGVALDLVTFGTPVRYGWETRGYSRLLHFIHHRPVPGRERHLAPPFPPSTADALRARWGDYIQQGGIAGTNIPPSLLSWRDHAADQTLGELLEAGLAQESVSTRLARGMRCPQEAQTLLVDYEAALPGIAAAISGHAVYLRSEWLLFHAEEIARRWYGLPG